MNNLREQYERRTGKKASMHSTGFIATDGYVAWIERQLEASHGILQGALDRAADLERRAACAEDVIAVIKSHEIECLDCDRRGVKYCDCLEKVLAKYEAVCKGGQ